MDGCGGSDPASRPAPSPGDIRDLTGLAPPVETGQAQQARQQAIYAGSDSLVVSTTYAETVLLDETHSIRWLAECSGRACERLDPVTGQTITFELGANEVTLGDAEAIGSAHGITLTSETTRGERLVAGIFDKLTSLNTLNLGHNGLSTLPAGIFDELTVLDWVDLRANDLSTLSDGIFDELTSLTGLGLSGNDLSTLSDGIFDELTSLTELGLAGNDFSTLSADIFDELISLTSLHLGDNSLSSLPDGIFDELTSLTRLGLWANDFTTLPDGIFDELTSLTELGLSGNDLSTLSADIFDGLNSLTSLYLEDNDLSTLPAGIFDKLTSLTGLWFWNNDLSTLPDGIFDEMTSLTALDLGGNNLSTLPDGLFDKLAKLSLRERFSPYGLSLHANSGAPFSPVVNAGADLTAQPGAAVSISGSVTGPWGDFVRWNWTQVDGPDSDVPVAGALPLTGGDTAMPSFTAPSVEGELYFKLVATPGHEGRPTEAYGHAYSAPDWVTVTVSNLPTSTSETPSVVEFRLLGNYPNPFNPSTTILLDVPQVAAVTVDVFNVLGQRVHREEFQAVAAGASKPLPLYVYHLSAGAYIYQVTAQMGKEVHSASGRMTLIK